jgi:gas vesicle protein
MRHHDEEMDDEPYVIVERHSGGGVGSFLLGTAIGVGIALLFAPRSGAATRRQIRRRARKVTTKVEDTITAARDAVEEKITSARDAIELRQRQVKSAVHAGRAAAQDARVDLEERIAERKAAQRTPRPS